MTEIHLFRDKVDEKVFALIRTIFKCEISFEEFGSNHLDICIKCESNDAKAIRKIVHAWD